MHPAAAGVPWVMACSKNNWQLLENLVEQSAVVAAAAAAAAVVAAAAFEDGGDHP